MTKYIDGETHQVVNQPHPLQNYNVFTSDTVLNHWVKQFGGNTNNQRLISFGHSCGNELFEAGFQANKFVPEHQSHDRFGHRIDQINYHPAYHQLMQHAIESGHVFLPWHENQANSHVTRAAMAYMHNFADPGSGCPLTMTFAAVPAISVQPSVKDNWLPKILSGVYDPRNIPWFEKDGVTIGMAMTEKQGGSDVRANTTQATPVNNPGPGEKYSLVGHKWFCSAPMCDAFLVLAQVDQRLSCFLVPRWREDGSKNPIHIQRLKDKLGNRSNASAEIEFRGAHGWLLGEESKGINTIIQMVALTRYDCMIGSSALMGQSVREAIWHTSQRQAFGKYLHEQPLMRNVLTDLAIEAEAALSISMRLAHALDNQHNTVELALLRAGTGIGKYWICKRAVQHTYEAMECLGGVGYINDCVINRVYREAPVNAIWEGSGNVQCLDLLRIMQKEPDTLVAVMEEIIKVKGVYADFDNAIKHLQRLIGDQENAIFHARMLVEQFAKCWQGATLIQFGDNTVADAFISSRFNSFGTSQYGCLPNNITCKKIIERSMPQI